MIFKNAWSPNLTITTYSRLQHYDYNITLNSKMTTITVNCRDTAISYIRLQKYNHYIALDLTIKASFHSKYNDTTITPPIQQYKFYIIINYIIRVFLDVIVVSCSLLWCFTCNVVIYCILISVPLYLLWCNNCITPVYCFIYVYSCNLLCCECFAIEFKFFLDKLIINSNNLSWVP